MSEKTVEGFKEKIIRLFLPTIPERKRKPPAQDLETIDPLERFEKAIRKDSQDKSKEVE